MEEKFAEIRESALSYLDRIESELPEMVAGFRAMKADRFGEIADVTEGVRWLMKANLAINGDKGNDDMTDRISDALDAMQDAVKNLDYVLIADILEYEILELSKDWRDAFEG